MSYTSKRAKKLLWKGKATVKTQFTLEKIHFKKAVAAFFLLNLATMLLVVLLKTKLPPQIPLYYGLARGEEQLAETLYLTLPSFVSLAILVLNLVVSFALDDEYLSKTLTISGLAAILLATITTVKIIFLVGSF